MTKAQPSLSALISREALPNDIGLLGSINETVESVLDDLLQGVRFQDLVINQSPGGDARFYSLKIVGKKLGFTLPGTEVSFLFFPAPPGSGDSYFPVEFEWRWGVKRYVGDFEAALFSREPRAFFDLFLKVANINETQFIAGLVRAAFGDGEAYLDLLAQIRSLIAAYGAGTELPADAASEVPAKAAAIVTELDTLVAGLQAGTPAFENAIDQIVAAFDDIADTVGADLDLCQLAFDTITRGISDPEEKFHRLLQLFQLWFGGVSVESAEDLLVPQFSLTITELPVALEFPRKWLIPLDADNLPTTDETLKSQLRFNAGSVRYSTRTGLTFDGETAFDFDKSAIGKTGLTLEIENAKIDFSRTTNIAEADAAGYPPDFVGVFIEHIEIGLPKKWFEKVQDPNSTTTLGVVGRNLLIGTGGITGEVALEALDSGTAKPLATKTDPPALQQMFFVLGKKPQGTGQRQGFKLGFASFDMKFRHNVIEETRIKGSLSLPRLAPTPQNATQTEIDIELRIDADGDFKVAATVPSGYVLKAGNFFSYRVDSLEVGKDDDKVYLSTSGALSFADNPLLGSLISKPIEIKKLRIHSDGSFELEGGTVPLPKSVTINLGPAKIAITAIHFGAHEREHEGVLRHYRYWGFDGGVDVNPGGVDARGDGIEFHYTVDGGQPHSFLTIQGIGIALVIPAGASKDKAALLLEGYLRLKDPKYMGSIKFALPRAKIEGAAAMEYDTRRPAWIIDVSLELPKAIPLGSTSLGIFGFRGLFGFRYIAQKTVIAPPDFSETLTENDRWGDYYRAAPKGVSVANHKFLAPEKTAGASNPISIGVGVSLATLADGGKAFTSQLFLLVSMPNLILLDGRADIMAEKRIGVIEDPDPPFYAYIAVSPQSIELGAGVDYLTPRDTGKLLALHASFEAAFFFEDHSAWFVHFGTKEKPMSARVLDLFDAYAYLMLSASGIEAGTGVHFEMHRKYGPVTADAYAYLDLWAYLSFQGAQSGGGIAAGGMVDVNLCGIGLTISLATVLTVEAPKPYRVAGSVELCVSVRVLIKTFTKCFTLSFEWTGDPTVDLTPVIALQGTVKGPPASAVHMLSGATYDVEFSTNPTKSRDCYVPLDAYIDVKFSKLLDPAPAGSRIGGYTSAPVGTSEKVPPCYAEHIVEHSYALESVAIDILADDGVWKPYSPYLALAADAVLPPADPNAAQTAPDLAAMPLGVWQKQDPGYGQIRFLALTPFSFIVPGMGFRPEQSGITPRNTYCVTQERVEKCLTWDAPWTYFDGVGFEREGVLIRAEAGYAQAMALGDPRLAPFSLGVPPGTRAVFRFPERIVSCRIIMATGAPQVTIRFQRRKLPAGLIEPLPPAPVAWPSSPAEYEDVLVMTPSRAALAGAPVAYVPPAPPIDRIVIEPPPPDLAAIGAIEERIDLLHEQWLVADKAGRPAVEKQIEAAEAQLRAEHAKTCVAGATDGGGANEKVAALEAELAEVRAALKDDQAQFDAMCTPAPPPPDRGAAAVESVLGALPRLPDGCIAPLVRFLRALFPPPPPPPPPPPECGRLAAEIAALERREDALEAEFEAARRESAGGNANEGAWPAGWECATFVHEICWLTEHDHAFNESIPGIDAIEADFSTMRDAVSRVVQPIWRPGHEFRIKLEVSDTVTPPGGSAQKFQQMQYVHFQTEAPIGHFTQFKPPLLLAPPPTPSPIDDGRIETPERSLKFYFDLEHSFPDPGGRLLYAKPVYWADVELDLFFARPHALHFFADWPDLGFGPRHYAMEIRVKDPAESRPPSGGASSEPYQAAQTPAPVIGTQTWVEDREPRRTEELTVVSDIQHPLANGGQSSTACLAIGGGRIVPAARALHSALGDLKPDKLYTAVVINSMRNVTPYVEADVASYPFRTSRHRDFASHIGSCLLADAEGNQRMAAFDLVHMLAAPADAAQAYAHALAIVNRDASVSNPAYPDHFDLLIQGALKLAPLSPPAGLEFNFLTNGGIDPAETYGLWLRSDEPLNDPRIPSAEREHAIKLFAADSEQDICVLASKDGCEAVLMLADGAPYPIADVAVEFDWLRWNPSPPAYVPRTGGTVRTAHFHRPVGGPP